jgi:c-di-GMP-binding flagellar brake protein YcgR
MRWIVWTLFGVLPIYSQVESSTRLSAVRDNLNGSVIDMTSVLIVGFLLIAGIAAVVWYEMHKSQKTKNLQFQNQWKKFSRSVEERRISKEMADLLRRVMQSNDRYPPEMVFSSAVVYENALESYFQKHGKILKEEDFQRLRKLREQLGYHRLHTETPYVSTRQIQAGERVNLRLTLKSTGNVSNVHPSAAVMEVWEDRWEIEKPFSADHLGTDQLNISLTRAGDADYLFTVNIQSVTASRIILSHSNNLIRKQQRNWVRIDQKIPVFAKIVHIDGNGQEIVENFESETLDFSAGGMSFLLNKELRVPQEILISFRVGDHLFDGILSVVRRVKANRDGHLFLHSIEFLTMQDTQREKIVRYIFDFQRKIAKERLPFGQEPTS